ncbi:MAG: class I SAM-dependent methyltransferase [Candidatus Methylomirabilia bacterium]
MRESADIETASDDYASRFSGPAGAWMLEVQESAVRTLLGAAGGRTLLEVGGGHGQLAGPLARAGWRVTVHGSDATCARRIEPLLATGAVQFVAGDILALPFPDRSFDCVVSVRLLPHCARWPALVAEMCRVARQAVIVDYPTSESLNRVAPALFGAKKRLEKNTRAFTLFTHREVEAAFAAGGCAAAGRSGEFFLPMVLHRALRCRPCSSALEALARAAGLTRRWGSPVVARFVRS